jgi:hypothetical protein
MQRTIRQSARFCDSMALARAINNASRPNFSISASAVFLAAVVFTLGCFRSLFLNGWVCPVGSMSRATAFARRLPVHSIRSLQSNQSLRRFALHRSASFHRSRHCAYLGFDCLDAIWRAISPAKLMSHKRSSCVLSFLSPTREVKPYR